MDIRDFAGRACDDAHACPTGLLCAKGLCTQSGDPFGDTLPPMPPDGGATVPNGVCVADGGPCTAGLGDCARTGQWVCVAGKLGCSAQPGAPTAERCDNKDNDCDGRADVSREVSLVTVAGRHDALSWVPIQEGGYAAVYEGVRGSGARKVYFRRFDARLAPVGNEQELGDPDARLSRAPVLVADSSDGYAIWADLDANGVKRVQVKRLVLNSGSTRWTQTFPNEDAVGSPRIAVSGSQMDKYVLPIWVRAPGLLVATQVSPQNGVVMKPPQLLTVATEPDGGIHRALEVDALNAGNNDFQVAWVSLDDDGGFTLRSRRIHETLDPANSLLGAFSVKAQVTQPRLVTNRAASSGNADETGLVWREVDTSVKPSPVSLRASYAPLAKVPAVTVAGPAPGGEWSAGVMSTGKGALVVWCQAEDGRMQGRGLDGGMALNLTPTAVGKPYGAASPPALAQNQGFLAIGYGSDGGLYGQLACEP